MEARIDFLQLEIDIALKILLSLDDSSDLVRAGAVSRFWRHFVTENGLCKQLCLRLFPQLSSVAYVTEPSYGMKNPAEVGSSNSVVWEALDREHRAYAFLFQALKTSAPCFCIAEAISASSTDNYPRESVCNTQDPRDRVPDPMDRDRSRASYWSSKGHCDPVVPETLIYKLTADLCLITEISVQPFRAYFQFGNPIYSAKSVRFRMGHPRSPKGIESDLRDLPLQLPADDKFIWTYTSQEFPMAQENSLQKFTLPEPALCIGGFLQIELLGRVQRQQMDGLFYICVTHVEVMGRSLFPAFDIEILETSGKFSLKYSPEAQHCAPLVSPHRRPHVSTRDLLLENYQDLDHLLDAFDANILYLEQDDWVDDDI